MLDEQGWEELGSLLAGSFDETVRIESESASRLAESGEDGFSAKLVVMSFESPEAKSDKPAKKGKKANKP